MRKIISLFAVLWLTACASSSPDLIQRGDAQRLSQVQDAVVLSTRPVVIDGSQSGTGAAAGGVVGGVAGSSVGGRRESMVVGIAGAVVGAVAGNAIERASTREQAIEILIQLPNGERRAIVQGRGKENLVTGDRVVLVSTGGKTRVTKAPPITGQY